MAPATPAINEALVQARVPEARHGQKGALVAQLCSATGKSRATVYRKLQIATVRPQRPSAATPGTLPLRGTKPSSSP